MRACLAWVRQHLLPATLFGRLACLLVVLVLASHFLVLKVMFEMRPYGPGQPLPQRPLVQQSATASPPSPPPPFPAGWNLGPPWGIGFDIGVRLLALLAAAWIGARWLSEPVRRLAQAAQALGRDVHRPPLLESGTLECREAIQVFNKMQAQICQQIKERDSFVAAVSHDLRTPLTRMALRVESLADAQMRAQFAGDIAEMNSMIAVTLDYMRGVAEAEPWVLLDVDSLVSSLVDDYVARGLAVTMDVADSHAPPIAVTTQAQGLRRCVGNLVDNAVRYGGSAHLRCHVQEGRVCIEVLDHGPGVQDAELDKIRLPFYRVDASRNRNHGGVGLGLSIAHDIAQRLSGTLHFKNREEGGLRVTLVLPPPVLGSSH
jgi:signal transduction histidine kinase